MATTEIYTLSLHDALPISRGRTRPSVCSAHPAMRPPHRPVACTPRRRSRPALQEPRAMTLAARRSEEHTSELQSRSDLVCRLLLEKKKNKINGTILYHMSH